MPTNSISFDRAASFFDQTRELPEIVKQRGIPAILAHVAPHGRVLDVGTGTGRISVPLLNLGADLIGIDLSLNMMGKLHEKYPAARLAQADASRLPFASHTFDAVLTTHVLHLVGPWREALREFKRVLKPGGMHLDARSMQPDTSVNQHIRGYWRDRVKAHGGRAERGSAENSEAIATELKTLGTFEEVEAVRFTDTYTPREIIEQLASRAYSSSWSIPDDIFEAAIHDLREWVEHEYNNLDQLIAEERRFMLRITHFE
jgi:ubiquinone/menaquinone biosynthesis C-methylase UbiE